MRHLLEFDLIVDPLSRKRGQEARAQISPKELQSRRESIKSGWVISNTYGHGLSNEIGFAHNSCKIYEGECPFYPPWFRRL